MQPLVTIPLEHGLLIASLMFVIGLAGVLVRRNIIFMFMSLEIMLNAAGLAFIVAGAHWSQPHGQVMFILVLTLAAAEVAIALALLLKLHRYFHTVDIDQLDKMRG